MTDRSLRRIAPYLLFLAGLFGIVLLLPRFLGVQPHGLSITRAEAQAMADREAKKSGIPIERSWRVLTWEPSPYLDMEFAGKPDLRRRAESDPVVGPRLGGFRVHYFRIGLEKFPSFGRVLIGRTGQLLGVRRYGRPEQAGANPTADSLRGKADAFVHSQRFPGAPAVQFEAVRPTILRARTDHIFRYKVPSNFPAGRVAFYVFVYFVGDELAGWEAIEEYKDGSPFRDNTGEGLIGTFIRFGLLFGLLLLLLIIFLKKYHAGEAGVETGAFLFGISLTISLIIDYCIGPHTSINAGFGGVDAQTTAIAATAFKFLFYDIPSAVVIFLAWSVGESYARERWGDKLASFDAILRRDPFNATVGRSLLRGLLLAPAVVTCALIPPFLLMLTGRLHPTLGTQSEFTLSALGGPFSVILFAIQDGAMTSICAFLFILAFFSRKRMLWLGILLAAVLGASGQAVEVPAGPLLSQLLAGFGGAAAGIAVFLFFDLLTSATAIFSASLLIGLLPILTAVTGRAVVEPAIALFAPLGLLLSYGLAAVATRREVVYQYDDLAPHVKRIVERERVKAEIDAANRIQSALLPASDPELSGASVSSHYRAASEIGGDYFDFLPLPTGEIGIAFGDVAGHGLTSGIVMAMAKSALLVQVDHDPSPRHVMAVLNDIVRRTAPKRMLMTFFFGVLDPVTQKLQFSSAGHLDPYVYRADTSTLEALSSWGFPLGVKRREAFREHSVQFSPGDRLILYSDGLIEALDDDGEPFGFNRFEQVLEKSGPNDAEEIKNAILGAVKKFTRNRPPLDDQTLVVISFNQERKIVVFDKGDFANVDVLLAGKPN
ncbi:MAG TPA: PP2C family protein-serine/threonine phosphatase [Thermoanaerobaculia bacterium]|nr:PP2C family protein-serine/threonine phosphatase [Thermoanaerobaculia bacterium]